jgi:hypothetical protein
MPNDHVKGPKPTAEAKQMGSEDIEAYVYNSNFQHGVVADLNIMAAAPD